MGKKRVSEPGLEKYIRTYLKKLAELTSGFSAENKKLYFPEFLIMPHRIRAAISLSHGVAIEICSESKEWKIEVTTTPLRIEDAMLPQQLKEGQAFFVIPRENWSISNVTLLTKEAGDTKGLQTHGGTVIRASKPGFSFVRVANNGDVRFTDVQFCTLIGRTVIVRKTICLWLFASNRAQDFSTQYASLHAERHFNDYLYRASGTMPIKYVVAADSPELKRTRTKLKQYHKRRQQFVDLINNPDTNESEIQYFLEANVDFLRLGVQYRQFYAKRELKKQGITIAVPDFLLERVDTGYCDILDIKLPAQKLIVREKTLHPGMSSAVTSAIDQVADYADYFDDEANRNWVQSEYGTRVYKPVTLVLIGNGKGVDLQELVKQRSRHRLVTILTYEDLLRYYDGLVEWTEQRMLEVELYTIQ